MGHNHQLKSSQNNILNSRITIIVFLLAFIVGCSDDEEFVTTNTAPTIHVVEVVDKGLLDKTLQHDNVQREYLLYVPESYTGIEAVLVVFSLHGAGGTKESQYTLSEFNLLADSENFILVTPEATAAIGNLTTQTGINLISK